MADSFNVEAVQEQVPAQVSPAAPEGTPDKVDVNEVHVSADTVILDPSSPEAVQVPDHEQATTPAHAFVDGKTPEEVFAGSASKKAPKSDA